MVIVCGGSNDVYRNEPQVGLDSLENFVNLTINTKVLILTLPQRYDLIHDSCMNKEIHSLTGNCTKYLRIKKWQQF